MRSAGTDDNCIGGRERAARAVGMEHGDLRPGLKCGTRAGCEAFLNFDCDNFAIQAGKLGEDCSVIAGSAAEVKNAIAGANPEQVEVNGPEAGLAVIQALRFVEYDEGVAVHMCRVSVLSKPLISIALNHPWTGPYEALAGHACEGCEDVWRGDVVEAAQRLGIKAPRGFDGIGHAKCGHGGPHDRQSSDWRYIADYRRTEDDSSGSERGAIHSGAAGDCW